MKFPDLAIGVAAGILLAAYAAYVPASAQDIQPAQIPLDSPQPDVASGQRVAANDYYDAYYDGGYGTFADGYWGVDGQFWYQDGIASRTFVGDTAGHFRHTPANGFALVRGSGVQREN